MQTLRSQFLLNPEITYLNFGSFGACPKPVFDDYIKWQYLLESEPVQFIAFDGPRYLRESREALGGFVNCAADDLVLVTNPSYAVNIIAKSFPLKEGDEVLTTNIEYGACDKTWQYYCHKAGAKYRQHEITFPFSSQEEFVDSFFAAVNERTKLIFISHITSSTALKLPVDEICKRAKAAGIITFVDGAHAPAQVPLDLHTLGADIYTGACHKWMMTPKGCSFLYVKKTLQDLFDPLVVSWGYDASVPGVSRFLDYHQMQGTRDFSAMLTIPVALKFMREHSWWNVADACNQMVLNNAPHFCQLLNAVPLSPFSKEFIGQLYSIQINTAEPEKLQRHLFEHYKIEIPVMRHGNRVFLRYSINGFNEQADLDKLYGALKEIIARGELLEAF
jgi:isopenicillin-N epimerase